MPSFLASKPFTLGPLSPVSPLGERGLGNRPYSSALDLDADAGREAEALEGVDDARVEVEDVHHALVGAHLELLA
jgi:hypothetical protein